MIIDEACRGVKKHISGALLFSEKPKISCDLLTGEI
jgi:hypothetical protein